MLQLKNITKTYQTGNFSQTALDGVSLNFRKSEFVAILGHSGSGKTTCLNVVGGLDQYDSGDLIINGKSTRKFKAAEWDAYRNNSVGFVFQSYNLISHLTVLNNVEMGMTLSGVSAKARRAKAIEVLERVGLLEHIHKKPNQLSGGQMQRVAIARALAGDPDIIMMDEPTGALDSATSVQIMELIKEISADKLCIMVTHNAELAESYADRIINFKDGKVVGDSNPYDQADDNSDYTLKKTKMHLWTALKLSAKNIATKKWRTALTSFASSIGIIGIALILSLSSGFKIQIDKFQKEAMVNMPVVISQTAMDINTETMQAMQSTAKSKDKYPDTKEVVLYDPSENKAVHKNIFTDEYMEYLKKVDPEICGSIGYTRMVGMNLLRRDGEKIEPATVSIGMNVGNSGKMSMEDMTGSMAGAGLSSYPVQLKEEEDGYLETNYDLLAGNYPKGETDMILVIDSRNRVDYTVLENLGFDVKKSGAMAFDKIVGTELKLIANDDYYVKTAAGGFMPGSDYKAMYNAKSGITLRISGILRLKEDVNSGMIGRGIAYSDKLVERILETAKDSQIVKAQKKTDLNVMTMQKMDAETKKAFLTNLGGDAAPYMIYLYPNTFEQKQELLAYLDAYNTTKTRDDAVIYTDMAETISSMTSNIMDAITLVLIAFASISLVVSLIMIGIITYISVLERTKEIGILRALGARKRDIANVFNAETFLIGACSGLLGIAIAYLLTIPVNSIIQNMTELSGVAVLNPLYAVLLVAISVLLTLLGGAIPSRIAAKKDPVIALRSE